MAIFLGVHKLDKWDETQISEGWNKYKESASSKGLKVLGAVFSLEKGFAYCQTEADSADQVREAHSAVEIPLEDVIEVKVLN
jgi:hypothetical protein